MKLTNAHKTLAAVFTVALTAIGFTAHAENIPGVAEQPASYFYTGKPYDADLGAYVFNARNYNPEINRWTSADPSGFPDGANNNVYAPVVTSELDPNGLWKIKITSSASYYYKFSETTDHVIGGSASVNAAGTGDTNGDGKFTSVAITGSGSGFYSSTFSTLTTSTINDPLGFTFTVNSQGQLDFYGNGGSPTNSNGSLSIGVGLDYRYDGDERKVAHILTTTGVGKAASGVTGAGITGPTGIGGSVSWTTADRQHTIITSTIDLQVVE